MNAVAHIALIFCVFVTVTKGWILPLGAIGHQTFSPKNLMSVSRVAREVNEAECIRVLTTVQCSSFVQNFINAVSQCGSNGSVVAIAVEKECRQNSAGEYCGSVGSDIADVITDCRSSASCSTECRNRLTELGCCLNSYMDLFAQNFTACGLDFPSACPPSSLNIPTSSNDLLCSSSDDLISFSIDYICSNSRPILDTLISNNCQEFARRFEVASCSYRGGKNCLEVITTTAITLVNAITSCPSTSSCSSSCGSSLNNLNNDLGCCLNQFNASLEVVVIEDVTYSNITANALWQECGITPPGVCATSINAAAPAAYTTAGNIAFLVLAASLFNFVSY